jgi:hypothetical protein
MRSFSCDTRLLRGKCKFVCCSSFDESGKSPGLGYLIFGTECIAHQLPIWFSSTDLPHIESRVPGLQVITWLISSSHHEIPDRAGVCERIQLLQIWKFLFNIGAFSALFSNKEHSGLLFSAA